MAWFKAVGSEIIGLFIDDGRFAAAIATWLTACWLVLPRFGLAPFVLPLILSSGLVAILIESATRFAAATQRSESNNR